MPVTPDLRTAERFLEPLRDFYEKAGQPFPEIEFVSDDTLPQPHRWLLVHASDMTSRLRRFHRQELGLRVLDHLQEGSALEREVVLVSQDNGMVVEFGAIRIDLSCFEGTVRQRIKEGCQPLGGILQEFAVPYRSAPRGYFRLAADSTIAAAVGAQAGGMLYGRCNVLAFESGTEFAEIVEILPPYDESEWPLPT